MKTKTACDDREIAQETALVHCGGAVHKLSQTVSPPIQRGSTVLVDNVASLFDTSLITYGRHGLATHAALRNALIELERGDDAFLFPSGLAAITGSILALVESGDEVLVVDSVYNPTRNFVNSTLARFGVTARYFDPQTSIASLRGLITDATRLIVLESPGSLTFEVQDIPAITRLAREFGILTLIDNTWSAGLLFKPLDHGVDVSIQALTKYACGHSDVFMGAAITRGVTSAMLSKSVREIGWTVSPDDAYQILRGLRTLPTRLARHGENALKVATWLTQRPEIDQVLCPGLPGTPSHALWKRDFTGSCGLFGVVLRPASTETVYTMLETLKLFGLGYSWGGFESLAILSDAQLSTRTQQPLPPGPLIRLHIGLENADDLIDDLRTGLERLGDL